MINTIYKDNKLTLFLPMNTETHEDMIVFKDLNGSGFSRIIPLKEYNKYELNPVKYNSCFDIIDKRFNKMIDNIVLHFKGNIYMVLDLAIDNNNEVYVIYRALYSKCVTYARPYKMFMEKVPDPNNEGKEIYRFRKITASDKLKGVKK